jgi:hypothetical protein
MIGSKKMEDDQCTLPFPTLIIKRKQRKKHLNHHIDYERPLPDSADGVIIPKALSLPALSK